jgi:hypothetical protein
MISSAKTRFVVASLRIRAARNPCHDLPAHDAKPSWNTAVMFKISQRQILNDDRYDCVYYLV